METQNGFRGHPNRTPNPLLWPRITRAVGFGSAEKWNKASIWLLNIEFQIRKIYLNSISYRVEESIILSFRCLVGGEPKLIHFFSIKRKITKTSKTESASAQKGKRSRCLKFHGCWKLFNNWYCRYHRSLRSVRQRLRPSPHRESMSVRDQDRERKYRSYKEHKEIIQCLIYVGRQSSCHSRRLSALLSRYVCR